MGASMKRSGVAVTVCVDLGTVFGAGVQSWRETFSKAPSQRSGQELQEIDKSLASRVEFFLCVCAGAAAVAGVPLVALTCTAML